MKVRWTHLSLHPSIPPALLPHPPSSPNRYPYKFYGKTLYKNLVSVFLTVHHRHGARVCFLVFCHTDGCVATFYFVPENRFPCCCCSSAARLRFMRLLVGREAANIADTKSYSQTQTLHTAASPLADARRSCWPLAGSWPLPLCALCSCTSMNNLLD